MTAKEILIMGCQQEEMSQADLAREIGWKSGGTVSLTLSRHEGMYMRLETFVRMMEAVGGEIVCTFPDYDSEFILDGDPEGVDYDRNMKMEQE